jgi:hypothetical protein
LKIEDLLPFQCWYVEQRFTTFSWWSKLKHLLSCMVKLFTQEIACEDLPSSPREQPSDVLFFKSLFRKDYDEIFLNVASEYPGNVDVISVPGYEILNYRRSAFSTVPLFVKLKRSRCIIGLFFRHGSIMFGAITRYGIFKGTWLFLQFLKISIFCQKLLQCVSPKRVVVFAEMQDMDRILSWHCACRKHPIPCATLQHGLYAEYLQMETVNRCNYQPKFVSHFLAWGESTRALVTRYVPDVHISVCGKPIQDYTPKVDSENTTYACVVIMDQNIFMEQNMEMLSIVRDVFSLKPGKIGVRFHPQNIQEDYNLNGMESLPSGGEWPQSKCYIGHTTSFLIDLLRANVTLFRYATESESVLKEPSMEFSTAQELRGCLEILQQYILQSGDAAITQHILAIKKMSEEGKG